MTAFAGMPASYVDAVTKYVEAVCSAIKAAPIKRKRFYHNVRRVGNPDTYPDDATLIQDKDVVVPLILLPRPDAVSKWVTSAAAQREGWRTAPSGNENRGTVYGRTLFFEPGSMSHEPSTLPAAPFEAVIPSWDLYIAGYGGAFFLELKKLVVTPSFPTPNQGFSDASIELLIGEPNGAKLQGELITVPASVENNRLWWTSIQHGAKVRRFLAYSLLDGNGVKRAKRFQRTADGPISPYVRPLSCKLHQPKTKQHDELLLPVPAGWPRTYTESLREQFDFVPHETWCLDDWFPIQPHACWVIREAEDSKPLMEAFLLMPASEQSDRPVFFIALFAETEPKRLIAELAALYKVSPEAALNSPETLERLNRLYEQVRDFPLAK